jgi:hypothetical protein
LETSGKDFAFIRRLPPLLILTLLIGVMYTPPLALQWLPQLPLFCLQPC